MAYLANSLILRGAQRENLILGTVKTLLFEDTLDLHDLYAKSFTIYNGGEPALAAGVIEVAPTRDGPWATLVGIAGGTLGSATTWNYTATVCHQFWKVSAAVASGSIATLSAYLRV